MDELFKTDAPESGILSDPSHLETSEQLSHGFTVSRTVVKTEQAASLLERKPGSYATVLTGPLNGDTDVDGIADCLAEELRQFFAPFIGGNLLVCGVGNRKLVSDSLGPETVRRLPFHIVEAMGIKSSFSRMSAICPDVLWHTNLNTADAVAGVAASTNASCVLRIDSMSCGQLDRLCADIQLNNVGLSRSDGSSNLDSRTIGKPIISIGVPTIICLNMLTQERISETMLTFNKIQEVIKNASYAIATAILLAAYPELSLESAKTFVEFNLVW